jgi:cell division protein FtsI/penicillin-binding protein 2
VAVLASGQEDPSAPLRTTLDRTVQQAVENALTGVSDLAAVVVVDRETSAVRASASRPLEGYNRAWEARYAPGDAFLPVTTDALVDAGVGLDDPVTCPASDAVVGARLTAPVDLGATTVGSALAAGCDTSLGSLVADLDGGDLATAAARFGFGTEPDLPLPAFGGSFPTPVDTTEQVRAGVGQGRVQASPLQLATVAAAASTGTWHAPFLLADQPSAAHHDLAAGTATALQQVFVDATAPQGSAAALAGTGAVGIGGTAPETGSATIHAWVLGTVDDLAFAVVVEDSGGDRTLADRIAAQVVRELSTLRQRVG